MTSLKYLWWEVMFEEYDGMDRDDKVLISSGYIVEGGATGRDLFITNLKTR